MRDKQTEYLKQLEICLHSKGIPKTKEIVLEYQLHIEDKVYEQMLNGVNEDKALQYILAEMLSPSGVAALYYQKKVRSVPFYLITVANSLILFACILITIFSINNNLSTIQYVWQSMVDNKWFLLISYCLLWVIAGFIYGQKNGFLKKESFYRYSLLAVLPNYVFMFFVLIGFQFGWTLHWFDFLADSFVFLWFCILLTLAFYPIVQLGYRVGVLKGI